VNALSSVPLSISLSRHDPYSPSLSLSLYHYLCLVNALSSVLLSISMSTIYLFSLSLALSLSLSCERSQLCPSVYLPVSHAISILPFSRSIIITITFSVPSLSLSRALCVSLPSLSLWLACSLSLPLAHAYSLVTSPSLWISIISLSLALARSLSPLYFSISLLSLHKLRMNSKYSNSRLYDRF